MNGAHIHLILNHIPIIGTAFALVLLGYGKFFRNLSITNAGLVTIVIVSIFSIPVFLSGEEAEHTVDGMSGISLSAIEEHEEQAEIAFWIMLMNGAVALGTLLASRESSQPSPILLWINLAFLVLVFVLMIRAGYSGGQIHHPEIKAGNSIFRMNGSEHDD